MNNLENTNESLENLEKEVWHLARVDLPAMQAQIDGLSPSASEELTSKIDKNTSDIASLTSRLSALETSSPSTEQVVAIFDSASSDPNLNLGKTVGLRATESLLHDLNRYKKLRIYMRATASNQYTVFERDLATFPEVKFFFSMPVNAKGFSIYEFSLLYDKQKFSFDKSSYFEFVGNSGETVSVKLTQATTTSHGIIRKIEGVL